MKRLIRLICLAGAALLLAGCAAQTGGSGTLKVGVRADIVGFGYYNPTTEDYYGMEIDLARELAVKLGYAGVELVTVTPETREAMLSDGQIDCLIAAYSVTEERAERFDLSPSYYQDQTSVMVADSSMIQELEGLAGKTVGVLAGSDARQKLTERLSQLEPVVAAGTATLCVEMESYEALSEALEQGTIGAVCADGVILKGYMKENRHILEETFGEEDYAIATQKGSGLSAPVSAAVEAMQNDGTIHALIDKWD